MREEEEVYALRRQISAWMVSDPDIQVRMHAIPVDVDDHICHEATWRTEHEEYSYDDICRYLTKKYARLVSYCPLCADPRTPAAEWCRACKKDFCDAHKDSHTCPPPLRS